jgi:hypothetical protein
MTRGDAAAPGDGHTAGKAAFDTSVAHQARMHDYVLGGKDNCRLAAASARASRYSSQNKLLLGGACRC